MSQTRRTTSLQGSSRLALSVGSKSGSSPAPGAAGRHPLKHEWSVSYVHRPPGTKVDYEKEIKRVATFGSIESFLHLYSHLTPPNEIQPVTDILIFLARIPTPGTWECMPDGGKFTIRLVHPITPVLYESILFALIGDQFEEEDRVVGCVLSARQQEDLISVWVEEEGEALRSGALRERILSILSLPPTAICEYRSNRALLDAAATFPSNHPPASGPGGEKTSYPSNRSHGGSEEQRYSRQSQNQSGQGQGNREEEEKDDMGGRGRFGGGAARGGRGYEGRNGWGGAGRGREVRE